ncbi:MAG: acyl carrier protein [Bacteroidetes bacterium]|nr:acyl carrier protein [Bacteroidota bacterium]
MSDQTLNDIKLETRLLILETLNIEDVQPEEISNGVSLLSGENTITIDSIDVLEVVVAIQKRFNVEIRDQNHARHIVNTIDTIAEFIHTQHQEES